MINKSLSKTQEKAQIQFCTESSRELEEELERRETLKVFVYLISAANFTPPQLLSIYSVSGLGGATA